MRNSAALRNGVVPLVAWKQWANTEREVFALRRQLGLAQWFQQVLRTGGVGLL